MTLLPKVKPASPKPGKTNWFVDQKTLGWKPLLPDQFVPFLQAMVQVGRRTFGDDWADAETKAQVVEPPIPDALKTWTGVVSVQRVEAAIDRLVRDILNKRLRAYGWRRDATVEPELLDPVLFSRTWVPTTLRSGRISVNDVDHMAFIHADDLAAQYAPLAQAPAINGLDVETLSPYLRLAIHVADMQGISATEHSTMEAVKEFVIQEAPKFGLSVGSGNDADLSANLAEGIAKAIRWPAARKGKAKDRG